MARPGVNRLIGCRLLRLLISSGATLGATAGAAAQGVAAGVGVSAIALLTRDTHTPGGRTLTEGYLTQPIVAGFLDAGWLHTLGMLNLEGLTLRRGELDLGEWGEGFVDRRHPHAYVHELMAGAQTEREHVAFSLYAGRGFASFGSDDPMVRPFVSYPVDHHLAQILERLVVVAGARRGPIALEASLFNGDEPLDPSTPPRFGRFGDSWAMRGTLVGDSVADLLRGAELSVSWAAVKSPESRDGAGLDQRKAHAAIRLTGERGGVFTRYALVEAARTTDLDHGHPLYSFYALLAEGALCRRKVGTAIRWERSDRPEEERLLDLFRSPRPATDVSILGITRWSTLTAAIALPAVQWTAGHASPYLEIARLTVDRTTAALFDPARFYGATKMWRLAAGVRFTAGHEHRGMGRYGAATRMDLSAEPPAHHMPATVNSCFS